MPINNYIASSAIAKPGVCTSTTRPASPYQGQVIYETDTARTLVWNGSGWVFLSTSSAGDVGLVKVVPTSVTGGSIDSTGTITLGSSVSSLTVNGAFSSSFDNYVILASGGVGSAALAATMRIGSASANYYVSGYYVPYSGAAGLTQQSNVAQFVNAGILTPDGIMGNITLIGPNLAKRTYYTSHYIYGAIAGGGDAFTANGYLNDTTQHTSFLWTFGGGTMTGGTVRVYGYRN